MEGYIAAMPETTYERLRRLPGPRRKRQRNVL